MFSYVGLFEFSNAQAKFTRTRYFIYYFFYYLENASMVGAWYVYFTYPEVWYYLPALLIITIVQLLGFILLQVYLYLYSRPRRKTTLCGLCFAHKDLDANMHFPAAQVQPNELECSLRAYGLNRPNGDGTSGFGVSPSMVSGRTGKTGRWTRTVPGGTCDPMFGQQLSQSAVPTKSRIREKNRPVHLPYTRSQSEFSSTILPAASVVSVPNPTAEHTHSQRPVKRRETNGQNKTDETERPRITSSNRLKLEQEEVSKQYQINSNEPPNQPRLRTDRSVDGRQKRGMKYPLEQEQPQIRYSRHTPRTENNHSRIDSREQLNSEVPKGVFAPRANQGRVRPQWPYARNGRR